MKKSLKACGALMAAFLMTALVVFGAPAPMKVAAAEAQPDPVVKYETDPTTVTVGNPFEARFHFTHDYTNDDYTPNRVKITVSSPNGAIRINNGNTYEINEMQDCIYDSVDYRSNSSVSSSEDGGENGSGFGGVDQFHPNLNGKYWYDLYMPEQNLKYVGPGSGTFRFTIAYYKDNKKLDTFTVQKTVVFGKGNSDSAILVDETVQTPTIQAGTSGMVGIPLVSSATASDVTVAVTLPEKVKMYLNSAGSTYKMSFSANEQKMLNLNLTVDSSVLADVYPISLKIDGSEVTAYIRVTDSATGSGGLVVESYKLDRTTVSSGSTFQMTVNVKNNGSAAYRNVVATIAGLDDTKLTMNRTIDSQTIPLLAPGETKALTFSMRSAAKMVTGNCSLDVKLTADGMEKETSSKVFVSVLGVKDASTSKPVIIIESYDFGGVNITGGKVFTLTLNIRNTSTTTAVQNMKITVESTNDENTGNCFTPANSSNTFFVQNLGANQTITEKIDLYPKADAEPKSYGINVIFKYESATSDDKTDTSDGTTETISIPLVQPDRFEVNDVNAYGPMYMGQQGQLTINYVNKGRSKIFNLSVEIQGNFTAPEMNTYIGNVDSGTADSFDTTLSPNEEGTLSGKAIFTYEDGNGETKTVEREFSCEVLTMEDPGMMDPGQMEPPPEEQPQGFPAWGIWLIIGGSVIVVVIVGLFVRKKLKARKQRLLDDADEYDEIPDTETPAEILPPAQQQEKPEGEEVKK